MKKVIFIEQPKEETKKPVEFTHYFHNSGGWNETNTKPSTFSRIVYLGLCQDNGDMFACYDRNGDILIYKGHLNSGEY